MTHQAIWRGSAVKVLSANVKRAVIITPCQIALQVSVHELRTATGKRRKKLDSKIF